MNNSIVITTSQNKKKSIYCGLKDYFNDIIPKLKRYSQKIDDLTLLSNKPWITIDEFSDTITKYIFLSNKDLIISINGNVKKGTWQYVENSSIVIEFTGKMKLYKIDFYDTCLLALRIDDSHNNYTILINENIYNHELSTINKITDYLNLKYLRGINSPINFNKTINRNDRSNYKTLKTNLGTINIELTIRPEPIIGNKVFIKNTLAPDGDYRAGVGWYYKVKDGIIIDICK